MLLARGIVPVLVLVVSLGILDHRQTAAQSVTGSVSLTPQQSKSLEALRQMARDAVRIYKLVSSIDVSVRPLASSGLTSFAGTGISYSPAGRLISVDPGVLGFSHRDALMATVLASIILHSPSKATTLADYERERRQAIMESNAKAVEILVRVKGVQQPEAVHAIYTRLLRLHETPNRGRGSAGELAPCDQIRDLLARFPEHREWSPKPECAPE